MTQIELLVEGKCPTCLEKSWFAYLGTQEIFQSPEILYLYDCEKCGTTLSLGSIQKANGLSLEK